jgi:hypothetical protein
LQKQIQMTQAKAKAQTGHSTTQHNTGDTGDTGDTGEGDSSDTRGIRV